MNLRDDIEEIGPSRFVDDYLGPKLANEDWLVMVEVE